MTFRKGIYIRIPAYVGGYSVGIGDRIPILLPVYNMLSSQQTNISTQQLFQSPKLIFNEMWVI